MLLAVKGLGQTSGSAPAAPGPSLHCSNLLCNAVVLLTSPLPHHQWLLPLLKGDCDHPGAMGDQLVVAGIPWEQRGE